MSNQRVRNISVRILQGLLTTPLPNNRQSNKENGFERSIEIKLTLSNLATQKYLTACAQQPSISFI